MRRKHACRQRIQPACRQCIQPACRQCMWAGWRSRPKRLGGRGGGEGEDLQLHEVGKRGGGLPSTRSGPGKWNGAERAEVMRGCKASERRRRRAVGERWKGRRCETAARDALWSRSGTCVGGEGRPALARTPRHWHTNKEQAGTCAPTAHEAGPRRGPSLFPAHGHARARRSRRFEVGHGPTEVEGSDQTKRGDMRAQARATSPCVGA